MSPRGCQKMSAKPCNQNAEENFPVLSLKRREQKPPNPLLIQDKDFYRLGQGPHPRQQWCTLGHRCMAVPIALRMINAVFAAIPSRVVRATPARRESGVRAS